MKTLIFLMLVSFGLGVDAQPGTLFEVATGLSFFFGAIGLSQPVIRAASIFAAAKFPIKASVSRQSNH